MARLAKDKGAFGEGVARFQVKSVMGRALPSVKEGKDNKETMALLSCGSRIEILSECCEQLGGEASGM